MKLNFIFSLLVILGIILGYSSCNQRQSKEKESENWDVKNTRIVESYNEINSLAIKNAQDSLDLFIKLFNSNRNENVEFSIKSKFSDGNTIENMWSTVSSLQNDSLFATLNNVPLKLTSIKLNDKVRVAKKDVEDWTIYQGDSLLFGNFMMRNNK